MSRSFTLADPRALDDLQLYLARATRIEEGSVRLVAGGGVLAVYVAALSPAGLTDEMPTVLGLRVVRILETEGLDAVVPLAALRGRLDRAQEERDLGASPAGPEDAPAGARISLPHEAPSVVWAAISPPRGGWQAQGPIETGMLERVAREGIAEVAAAVPEAAGEQIVRRVRSEVWGRPIPGAEHLPAGAAFAALGLGFLGPSDASGDLAAALESYETGTWTRLSSPRGHILVKRRAWTLSR